jgi:general nucleoside transport system permease protein
VERAAEDLPLSAVGVERAPWQRLGVQHVAVLGVLLGCLGFFVALPPIGARAPYWPVLFGVLAIAVGVAVLTRGVRRLGWFAVASGLLGIGLGILSTRSSSTHLVEVVSWAALFTQMFAFATPLTYAAIGGMFSERSGVVNIGLEGMMLTGAFFGVLGADKLHHWYLGVLTAVVAGGLLALIHAVVSIHMRADQIVSGTAINFLALGVTGYFYIQVYGANGTPSTISQIPDVRIPGAKHAGAFGQVFGHLNLLVWVSFLVIVLSYIVMFKTPIGLRIRSVGEHPRAADTVGIPVYKLRYGSVITSGVLAALGGAYLSIAFVGSFDQDMTAGRGFIALAAVIFGKWKPYGAFGACLLFGFASGLADRLQSVAGVSVNLLSTLPYVLTLIALVGLVGRSRPPAADGQPYVKG